MNVSTQRFARNQSIFREANERLREVAVEMIDRTYGHLAPDAVSALIGH